MFSSQSTDISLNTPCREVAAIRADKVESRFLVGSCAVQRPQQQNAQQQQSASSAAATSCSNYLYLLRFHTEVNELGMDAAIPHEDPIHRICCSPIDANLVVTCAQQSNVATLFKLPASALSSDILPYDDDDDAMGRLSSSAPSSSSSKSNQLETVATLVQPESSSTTTFLTDVLWRDSGDADSSASSGGDFLTVDIKGGISRWDLSTPSVPVSSKKVSIFKDSIETSLPLFIPQAAWDPHANGDAVAVSRGAFVDLLDWRLDTSVPTGTIDCFQAHRYNVTDIDYNPNKPYVLSTAGQDGLIKFWDLRLAKHPLMVARGGHSHWVQTVQYNPFHDQLVLSTGTDAFVNLWRVSTISSAPLLTLDDGDAQDDEESGGRSETAAPNVRVARHEQGDSVYGAAWGMADAWIYMTLSYDGKAVLSHVPSKEKYKILL